MKKDTNVRQRNINPMVSVAVPCHSCTMHVISIFSVSLSPSLAVSLPLICRRRRRLCRCRRRRRRRRRDAWDNWANIKFYSKRTIVVWFALQCVCCTHGDYTVHINVVRFNAILSLDVVQFLKPYRVYVFRPLATHCAIDKQQRKLKLIS